VTAECASFTLALLVSGPVGRVAGHLVGGGVDEPEVGPGRAPVDDAAGIDGLAAHAAAAGVAHRRMALQTIIVTQKIREI
jgi:hypothetical protein